jgi:hypothetical protein
MRIRSRIGNSSKLKGFSSILKRRKILKTFPYYNLVHTITFLSFMNFSKFHEALSKKSLKEYGNLGQLIKQGTYYQPLETLDVDGLNKTAYLEDVKEWRKEKARMRRDILGES